MRLKPFRIILTEEIKAESCVFKKDTVIELCDYHNAGTFQTLHPNNGIYIPIPAVWFTNENRDEFLIKHFSKYLKDYITE